MEEWNEDDNNHLSDGCDDEMPFLPYYHGLDMKDSVLLSNLACDNTPGRPFTEEDQSVDATELRVVLIRDGIEHILSSLGIPSSARQPFIRVSFGHISLLPAKANVSFLRCRIWSKPFQSIHM